MFISTKHLDDSLFFYCFLCLFVLFLLVFNLPVEFEDEEDVDGEGVESESDEFDAEEFEEEEERST